jgi:hypothetical protein
MNILQIPNANVEIPGIAQRLLLEWEQSQFT